MSRKIRLAINEQKLIKACIRFADSQVSLPVETGGEWQEWVAFPVFKYMLAPRHARAVLDVVGILADHGVSVSTVLADLCEKYVEPFDAEV
ncbi:MAG: hypothetical protein DRH50_10975 [Deltaproteobacteria bacterium]|nr:MAG: hypothetical protein DRH50_10975 [Deltaproteobacteria bacterium]